MIKNALVTGASGYIGEELCQFLMMNNVNVRAICHKQTPLSCHEIIHHNLCEPWAEALKTSVMNGIDTIFHLASVSYAQCKNVNATTYWQLNVISTEMLLDLAKKANVKSFVYFSSVRATVDSRDVYGYSKWAAEQKVIELGKRYNIHVCILRPALVYGKSHLRGSLLTMFVGLKSGFFPPIPEKINRSLVHIDDVVKAAYLVATNKVANAKTYILTDKQFYSNRSIYNALRKTLNLLPINYTIPTWILRIMAYFIELTGRLLHQDLFFNRQMLEKLLSVELYSSTDIEQELGWCSQGNFYHFLSTWKAVS